MRSSRWQRCRPLGRRPHPQAAARAGPGVRRALGVATHDLAIRERRAPQRALPDGARVGGVRHRASSASPAGAGAPDHDRSGPDRRPDAWRPAAHVLQRALGWCYCDAGVSELPRGGAVSVRGGAAAREGSGRRRDPRPARLLPLLRAAFPRARFLVRLDGGFATPEIFDFLDAEPRLDYVVAMAKNAVLQRHAESAMQVARAQSEVGGETAHVYTDTRYAAGTWDHERRVVIKAEVVRLGDREPRDNPRFVVTTGRRRASSRRSTVRGTRIGSRNCSMGCRSTARAAVREPVARLPEYVLMQELRLRAARTACARSQVTWLRDC